MKRQSKTGMAALLILAFFACSCRQVSETPPTNSSYDSSFIMPEAEILSAEDRAVISAMEDEYDENYNK